MQSWLTWLESPNTLRFTNWGWNPFRPIWDETSPSHVWGVGGFKGPIKRNFFDPCFFSLHALFWPMYLLLEIDLPFFSWDWPTYLSFWDWLTFLSHFCHCPSIVLLIYFLSLSMCYACVIFFDWLDSFSHYWFGTWKECALNVLWRNVEIQLHHPQGRPNISTFMCLWF